MAIIDTEKEGNSFEEGLKEVFTQLKYDKDSFWLITGKEGTGKSYLGLYILHRWRILTRGEVKKEDIVYICFNEKQFRETLEIMKPYDLIIFDEAGDLDSRESMSKKIINIEKMYKRIRGLNYFSIFILPNLRSMTRYFKEERANCHINFSYRHKSEFSDFEFYGFNKLQELSNKLRKGYTTTNQMYKDVAADWEFRIEAYKGILEAEYKKKKLKSMKTIINNETDNKKPDPLDFADNPFDLVNRKQ